MFEGKRSPLIRTLLVCAAEASSVNGRQGRKRRKFEVMVPIKSERLQQEKL